MSQVHATALCGEWEQRACTWVYGLGKVYGLNCLCLAVEMISTLLRADSQPIGPAHVTASENISGRNPELLRYRPLAKSQKNGSFPFK